MRACLLAGLSGFSYASVLACVLVSNLKFVVCLLVSLFLRFVDEALRAFAVSGVCFVDLLAVVLLSYRRCYADCAFAFMRVD